MSDTMRAPARDSVSDSVSRMHENRRQVLYWRLLARLFDPEEQPSLESVSVAIVDDIGLPAALLDPSVSVDNVIQRFPDLAAELRGLMVPDETPNGSAPGTGHGPAGDAVPGDGENQVGPSGDPAPHSPGRGGSGTERPGDGEATVPAAETNGAGKTDHGGIRADDQPATQAERVGSAAEPSGSGEAEHAGTGAGEHAATEAGRAGAAEVRRAALVSKLLLNVFSTGTGNVTAGQLAGWQQDAGWLECALGCEPGELRAHPARSELGGVLAGLEGDLVKRMHLREVLADPRLARRLTPSMSLVEQLLRDKANLSGVALANAKALIRRFVDEVAEVLRTQVEKTSVGTIDRSVPPKRVFRNLDLERTIWKNLTNWNAEDERLYVDRLYYRHTARRTTPARLIVVVDQSGSMVDAMVNCTILASIFAGLPKVDVHLIAYDTRALDLTPWVNDPFEVLLRTTLGGGTNGTVAMNLARPKIADPRNTAMVWISDFYDVRELMTEFEAVHRSGVRLIPVGSVNSSGHQSVDPWYRERLKDLGTPVISGHIRKLVFELKTFLG
ncbi:VWA domain-containing protein [Thermopolyspora sp. NPDC052614]|uniref:VWA domain-containing protein n=1 Tax=Thermopolyspora sp. NPDC052614 TaxID=3155682 RepID=UPI003448353A